LGALHFTINRGSKTKGTLNDFAIQRLCYEINKAEIREPDKIPNNIVTMNSEINFSYINLEKQGIEKEYKKLKENQQLKLF
jgi:transcription elongation GreA/GreB family factor